jgi:hypothetical protein
MSRRYGVLLFERTERHLENKLRLYHLGGDHILLTVVTVVTVALIIRGVFLIDILRFLLL